MVFCDDDQCEESFVVQVMCFKKRNAKADGVYEILKCFNVYPVFNQGHKGGYLEVVGDKINVTIAHYITDFLSHSIDSLWHETKKENPNVKGVVAKNNFIRSFCNNVAKQTTQSIHDASTSQQLIQVTHSLQRQVELVYPNLRSTFTNGHKRCSLSQTLGKNKANGFKINPGLSNQTKQKGILSWIKSKS